MNKKLGIIACFLLSFIGGFFDLYSIIFRGGKFTFMQTGNLINIGNDIINKNYAGIILGIFILVTFIIGIIYAFIVEFYFKKYHKEKYIRSFLIISMIILIIPNCFFNKTETLDISSIALFGLSISGGILLESFRNYGISFTSTMMTNNIKIGTHALFEGIFYKNKTELFKSFFYLGVVISFLMGVITLALISLANINLMYAPFLGILIYFLVLIIEFKMIKMSKNLN